MGYELDRLLHQQYMVGYCLERNNQFINDIENYMFGNKNPDFEKLQEMTRIYESDVNNIMYRNRGEEEET